MARLELNIKTRTAFFHGIDSSSYRTFVKMNLDEKMVVLHKATGRYYHRGHVDTFPAAFEVYIFESYEQDGDVFHFKCSSYAAVEWVTRNWKKDIDPTESYNPMKRPNFGGGYTPGVKKFMEQQNDK